MIQIKTTISTLTDFPEDLFNELQQFIEQNPKWNQDRDGEGAIAQFLMQQAYPEANTRIAAQAYLGELLGSTKEAA